MKKLLFFMFSTAFMAVSAFAKIPARVTNAFQNRYAGATNVEWKHGLGNYAANFTVGDYRYEAIFNRKGTWMRSEKLVKKDMLPLAVKDGLDKSKYRHWEIKSSYVEYLPHEKPQYHVVAAKGEFKRKKLSFDERGEMIRG